uniref:Uncharacterized protein n=1 Tax=Leptobrachium leishanense TaxID=445787 RepID=A0A8C5R1C9_9ANUR
MDVTTTSTRITKFEARFFHVAVEEEFGRAKRHFSPIKSLAFHRMVKAAAAEERTDMSEYIIWTSSISTFEFES